ncbi:MAG TPA: NAD(P)-dependent alcohol dehydrogenase, partial [Thermoanaerobaculia bacterium]|nr:NAD(P)-dependent alcohol dehydrogenase [Thermoanaerobaculia bacterium]
APLERMEIDRRDPGPKDVRIDVLYCGICHSDLHTARNEWHGTTYPCIPGHEIVGRVAAVGSEVKGFKVGDMAGVGCLVDSCRSCSECKDDLEQFCAKGAIFTYNSPDAHLGGMTYGGYTNVIVVDEAFVLKVPAGLDPAGAAPLLCAGVTTYSPLRHWGAGPGKKVGVVGLGGLGHMAVKLAHAMGAHVVLFTTSAGKTADAKRLGADEVVLSKDPEAMKAHAGTFHFILDTVAASHDLDAYTTLLRRDGTLCLVGAPEYPHPSPTVFNLIFGRKSIAGSLIGGIKETQEMLDFCAAKGLTADIETIPVQKVNEAYERMLKSDVKYRFVIDMASLK